MKPYLAALMVLTAAAVAATQSRTTVAGVYASRQAKRGEAVYLQKCIHCHGPDLSGTAEAPALTGPSFTASWDGVKLSALFDRIKSSMPNDAPGSLSDRQYADVLAFLLSKSRFPAGPTELVPQANALSQITFKAAK